MTEPSRIIVTYLNFEEQGWSTVHDFINWINDDNNNPRHYIIIMLIIFHLSLTLRRLAKSRVKNIVSHHGLLTL